MAARDPQICVTVFDSTTREELFLHPTRLGSPKRILKYHQGDIVLLYDKTTKEIFAIGILRTITNGSIYSDAHLFDAPLYTAEYGRYNKYEVGVKLYRIQPVSMETINEECGLPRDSPLLNAQYISFKKPKHDLSKWVNRVLVRAMIEEASEQPF